MPKPNSKDKIENLPIADNIIIKIADQSYQVKIPFTFEFWIELMQLTESLPNDIDLNDKMASGFEKRFQLGIAEHIYKIMSKLTGVDVNVIIEKQTEIEDTKAQIEIYKQISKEITSSPFCRKALYHAVKMQQIHRQIGGK